MVQTIAQMLGWNPRRQAAPEQPAWHEIAAEAAKFGVPISRDLGTPLGTASTDEMREKNRARAIEIGRRNAAAKGA